MVWIEFFIGNIKLFSDEGVGVNDDVVLFDVIKNDILYGLESIL